MEALGINFGLIEFIILIVLFGLPIISLVDLAKKKLFGIPLALWVMIICAIPLLGPLAYWIIKPTAQTS
jgi:hypothetical protein